MAIPITGLQNFPTPRQIADQAILNVFNKQAYLGNQFSYIDVFSAGGTSEANTLLLSNPSSNGTGLKLPSLFFNLRKITALTASHSVVMNIYIAPSVSAAGTAQTPVNVRPASATTSLMTLTVGPTTTSKGTLIDVIQAVNPTPGLSTSLFILDPGQTALITTTASNTSDSLAIQLGWYEL